MRGMIQSIMNLVCATSIFQMKFGSWVPVAHACNPSYSGGRDLQEDRGLKPAQANSSRDLILKKKPNLKQGWWSVAQVIDAS
jgi:hypothetical protein